MSTELSNSNPDLQLIELWIHGRSPCTQDYYRRSAYRLLAHTSKPLLKTTLGDVQSFATVLTDSGLAVSSCRSYLAAIKSLLSFGNKLGLLPVNVGVALTPPTGKDTLNERILTEGQVQLMFHLEPSPENRLILRLLYATGIRVSELCQLKWHDLNKRDNSGQITVFGKGSKTRTILLNENIWNELIEFRTNKNLDNPVFVSNRGRGQFTRQHIFDVVKAAGDRALLPNVSPHWLRHAHASHSLERGAPIHLVQATLGHSSVATTGKYLHARPTDSSSRYLSL